MLRHAAELRRQPAFDFGLYLAGENGSSTFGADSDDDRIAVDNRRHDEVALRPGVDHVDGKAARPGGGCNAGVEQRVIAGGEHKRRSVEVALYKIVQLDRQVRNAGGGDILAHFRGDDLEIGARLGEQAELLQSLLTAADDEHVATFKVYENREVSQRLASRCQRAGPVWRKGKPAAAWTPLAP